MAGNPDHERISRKAHELWEAEGRPHGRDQDHWDAAREIIALEDSMGSTLLPRDTGAEEPEEPRVAVDSLGDVPGLTDQGEHPLTDTSREPASTSPKRATRATGDTTGAVARPKKTAGPGVDDAETVKPKAKVAAVSGTSRAAVPPAATDQAPRAKPSVAAAAGASAPAGDTKAGSASTPKPAPTSGAGKPAPKPGKAGPGPKKK